MDSFISIVSVLSSSCGGKKGFFLQFCFSLFLRGLFHIGRELQFLASGYLLFFVRNENGDGFGEYVVE